MSSRHISTTYDSPIGSITLVADPSGLCGLYNDGQKHWPAESDTWTRDFGPAFDSTRKWLDQFFSGAQPSPTPPLAFSRGTDFQKSVWTALLTIPHGKTVTYGEIARQIGAPKAVRAIGAAVGRNPVSIIVPCHRVIGGDGALTGYAGGLDRKRWLLIHEGAQLGQS